MKDVAVAFLGLVLVVDQLRLLLELEEGGVFGIVVRGGVQLLAARGHLE